MTGGKPTAAKGRSTCLGSSGDGDGDELLAAEEADGDRIEVGLAALSDVSMAPVGEESLTESPTCTGISSSTHSFVGRGIKLV